LRQKESELEELQRTLKES